MLRRLILGALLWLTVTSAGPAIAQQPDGEVAELTIATVTRAPFSMEQDGQPVGFSIALWEMLAQDIGLDYRLVRYDTFGGMMSAVESGEVDAAIANISITAQREQAMDFSQPIFETGLQIMLRGSGGSTFAFFKAILTPQLFLATLFAVTALVAAGMLMWFFERRHHDYFAGSAKDAVFPAFWWALNLIISGGYEEKMPRSVMGRLFGTLMVVCSLFVVSIFVANITATLTLDALSEDVHSISDIEGRRVGTTTGSTAAIYLDQRGVQHRDYADLSQLLEAFEAEEIEVVVFDGPVLAYFVSNTNQKDVRLVERVFQREGYGIALPTGSALREPLNRALLRVREDGTYAGLVAEWFGGAYSDR